MNFICDKIEKICDTLKDDIIKDRFDVSDVYYAKTGYKKDNVLPTRDTMEPFDANILLQGNDGHYWFNLRFKTPKKPKLDSEVYFTLATGREREWDATNPQCLVYVDSEIVQGLDVNHRELILEFDKEYDDIRRIDIKNEIDWHNEHTLLKAHFPFNVHANKAVYDIQFGNIERSNHENTSWDAAKFEVCAHKWADISEDGYGISILNDCKYGYSCLGNEMTLSLLKCATYPNPEADKGRHSFTYSIYPHAVDFKTGGTVREAYKLNQKLVVRDIEKHSGKLDENVSMISCDCENIIIETVKLAEDDNSIVIRLYDAYNRKSNPTLTFGFDVKNAYISDMLENAEEKLEIENKRNVKINVSNYEIITLKIEV